MVDRLGRNLRLDQSDVVRILSNLYLYVQKSDRPLEDFQKIFDSGSTMGRLDFGIFPSSCPGGLPEITVVEENSGGVCARPTRSGPNGNLVDRGDFVEVGSDDWGSRSEEFAS
jgi:hypothetical protein